MYHVMSQWQTDASEVEDTTATYAEAQEVLREFAGVFRSLGFNVDGSLPASLAIQARDTYGTTATFWIVKQR